MRTSSRPRSMSAFEIVESPIPELVGAHAVVWTTTPWTIPVNQAIAYGPEVEYVLHGARSPMAASLRCAISSRADLLSSSLDRRADIASGTQLDALDHGISCGSSKAPTSPAPSPATRCTSSAASSPSRGRSCPATSSPPTRAPASSTWRPTMARTISSCASAQRHRPGVRGRRGRLLPRRLAVARRPGQRHQRQVQRARRADLLGPARGRRAARRERRLPAQLPAFVAVEGQGHLPLHPAMVHRHGQAADALVAADPRRAALGE